MALPQNPVFITNAQYQTKVVDLSQGQPNGPVILFSQNGGNNQQWSFEQIGGDTYNVQSQIPAASFINGPDGVDPPVPLSGNISPTVFKVEVIGIDGAIAIIIKKDDLYWTAPNGNDLTQIILDPGHGAGGSASEAQKWLIASV